MYATVDVVDRIATVADQNKINDILIDIFFIIKPIYPAFTPRRHKTLKLHLHQLKGTFERAGQNMCTFSKDMSNIGIHVIDAS